MKKNIFIILFICLSISSFSQKFNGFLVFGLSASQIDGDTYGGYHKIGGTLGFDVTYALQNNWSFQTGIDYIGKGAANSKTQYYYRVRLNYVQVPVLWNYYFSEYLSLTGGVNFSYLILGVSPSNPGDLQLRNFVPCIYGSVNYKISDKLTFIMGGAYSIINAKKYGDIWMTNTLTLGLSYKF